MPTPSGLLDDDWGQPHLRPPLRYSKFGDALDRLRKQTARNPKLVYGDEFTRTQANSTRIIKKQPAAQCLQHP